MRRFWFLPLLLLALILLTVACTNSGNTDSTSEVSTDEVTTKQPPEVITEIVTVIIPVTEPETSPQNEPETDPPAVTDTETQEDVTVNEEPTLTINDIVAAVISREQIDLTGSYHLQTDLSMDMLISVLGFETKLTLTGDMSMKQEKGEAAALVVNLPTQEPYCMTYLDGMLYVERADGRYRCPLGDEEQALAWSEILGTLLPSDDSQDEITDLSGSVLTEALTYLLSMMDASVMFNSTSMTEDKATGDITLTLTGMSQGAQAFINELVSAMANTGNTEFSDEDMSLMLELLTSFDMDTLSLTMIVDAELLLRSVVWTFSMELDNISALMGDITQIPGLSGDLPVTMVTTMTTTFDRNAQVITMPEDADTFEEADWREIFGLYTAEMLGLVPDQAGIITLSENPDTFALQCQYIMEHPDEFADTPISAVAKTYGFSFYEDQSVCGYLYQSYGDGSPAKDSYLPVVIPTTSAVGMTPPQDGSTVRVTLVVASEIYDGTEYQILEVTAYALISGPAAVG